MRCNFCIWFSDADTHVKEIMLCVCGASRPFVNPVLAQLKSMLLCLFFTLQNSPPILLTSTIDLSWVGLQTMPRMRCSPVFRPCHARMRNRRDFSEAITGVYSHY